jgi:hypothetical protein
MFAAQSTLKYLCFLYSKGKAYWIATKTAYQIASGKFTWTLTALTPFS